MRSQGQFSCGPMLILKGDGRAGLDFLLVRMILGCSRKVSAHTRLYFGDAMQ